MKAKKARLDADRTAEPLTRIVHHPKRGDCIGPAIPLVRPQYEDENGKRHDLIGCECSTWRGELCDQCKNGKRQNLADLAILAGHIIFSEGREVARVIYHGKEAGVSIDTGTGTATVSLATLKEIVAWAEGK